MLAGVLMRSGYESEVDHWLSDLRIAIEAVQGDSLHFRKISETRKGKVCHWLAQQPVKCFVVASNKKNMVRYNNVRAEIRGGREWFYNFCIRLMLERVSELCKHDAIKLHGKPKKVKIIYRERSNHSYAQTNAYFELLKYQHRSGSTFLRTRVIDFDVIDRRLMMHQPHESNGGLQMADILASAFYQAVDTSKITSWTTRYAKALKPVMATKWGRVAYTGVVLQPTPPKAAKLTADQKRIFEFYDYRFG